MFYKILIIVLIIIAIGLPGEAKLGNWRWATDSSLQFTVDKQLHYIGSFGLYYLFTSKGMTPVQSITTTIGLGLFKEGMDALVPWEQYGFYGGDGFSRNDVIYNLIGVGSAYLIDRLWENNNETKTTYAEIYPRHIRFSLYFN